MRLVDPKSVAIVFDTGPFNNHNVADDADREDGGDGHTDGSCIEAGLSEVCQDYSEGWIPRSVSFLRHCQHPGYV